MTYYHTQTSELQATRTGFRRFNFMHFFPENLAKSYVGAPYGESWIRPWDVIVIFCIVQQRMVKLMIEQECITVGCVPPALYCPGGLARQRSSGQRPLGQRLPLDRDHARGQKTPVKILPCPKLRLKIRGDIFYFGRKPVAKIVMANSFYLFSSILHTKLII